MTKTLDLLRAAILRSDLNARQIKAVSMLKVGGQNGGKVIKISC